ncbi:MobV family relaxase [Butyricimonas hominis]|uniref:Plasmid recombination protein n=1 Tax=Butyricimonas hominis TaxID=2763032 RepID=A0ABR7CXG7_9BACT|nr:MobV family relaxase [Butyricimonas hominis]MBC5620364.1 plasmid recombination protein [Butyricimonas hominis]
MGYAVLHMEKTSGTDAAMSAHIERTIKPKNADESRTHLNRELITFPDGVYNRTQAIQHRLDTAGLTRKIGNNQVRAIRVLLTGTHEDMIRITNEGRLDEWCSDNLKYLADTFGRENIVSAVLHMDEQTPHIHATLVPIVKGERKRKKKEEQVKKRYRKKPTDTARLCADEIMTRTKLKSYQDTYAQAMSGYGLQRGIDGSEAKHISTRQYYRDLMQQTEHLRADIGQLQDRKETAQEELRRAKKEMQTEKLKGAATTAATNIAESVGSFFGSNKVKTLERENSALHQVVATHEETIETLQTKLQTIQADHSRQVLDMQQKHIKELQVRDTEHKKEVSRLTALLNKTLKWFPQIKGMLNLERLCFAVGFNQEQTAVLMMGKPLGYSGELYSEEHKRKFMAKEVKAKVFSDKGRFVLTIDLQPIGEWFKEQFEKLRQGVNIRQSPKQSRLKL